MGFLWSDGFNSFSSHYKIKGNFKTFMKIATSLEKTMFYEGLRSFVGRSLLITLLLRQGPCFNILLVELFKILLETIL